MPMHVSGRKSCKQRGADQRRAQLRQLLIYLNNARAARLRLHVSHQARAGGRLESISKDFVNGKQEEVPCDRVVIT